MATVRLASITKRYGATLAVDALDLEVRDGEMVTLLGPSGCGKTTTLRMIAGLVEPSEGRVYFDDDDVTFLPPRKRNIGFVFQTPALFPHLSVSDNVGFGLSVKGAKKDAIEARVEEMLAMVGLKGYGPRLPAQMSGGQQQRVALARVLATDPRVLLFDEPLSALDRNLRDTLKYSILDLQRRTGKTAVYVTHDQSEAFAISDRIVVMNAGRVEQVGTQTEIYLQPQTRFVAEFIGANNGLEGTLASRDGSDEDGHATVRVGDLLLQAHAREGLSVGDAVIAYLRPEDIRVLEDGDRGNGRWPNVVEGVVDRVIFEGATAQLRVDVSGRQIRVDVSGNDRLTLMRRDGKIRLGFQPVAVIPASEPAPAADETTGS
jgi:putative spermidine/putrescine transport system ATP-binding protein